jgi:hypothetical protein
MMCYFKSWLVHLSWNCSVIGDLYLFHCTVTISTSKSTCIRHQTLRCVLDITVRLTWLSLLHSRKTKSDFSSYSTYCGIMKSPFPYHLPCSTLVTLFKFRLVSIRGSTTVVLYVWSVLINYSFSAFTSFVAEMSTTFASYIDQNVFIQHYFVSVTM